MPRETLCPKCGAPLSGEVAGGFCTACLLEEGLSSTELAQSPITLRYFGDYELLEEIARGGMGVVFKARQQSLNRVVAVKMILSGHLASEAQTQRFRAEARAAAALQHPGVVAIHEVGEHEGLLFFSMDYVAGQNLAQQVRDGPWPAVRAAQCVRDIAEAIQYAHEQGVLHRDLKPSNVLIDLDGKPHVTDFGLAKQLNSDAQPSTNDPHLTLSGQVLGSPNFMPPEQAAGKHGDLTPASDVYSLGAILYHCLTGRPPFVAETLAQTLRMVAEQEPVSPRLLNAGVPRDLETICLKCLEKDPSRRYATAQQLADELDRFLHDEPIEARPIGPVLRLHRWCVRNKALAATGTAVLALLLVVAIGSPIAAIRINRERKQAEANANKAQLEVERSIQVAKFLRAILDSAGPSVARGRDATLFREMLEATSERVGKEITDQPSVQGDIYATIGSTFMDIGDHRRAITNLELAVKSYRRAEIGDHPNLAFSLNLLGFCQSFTGDVTNGNKNARLGLEMARKCNDKEMLFTCLMNYAGSFLPWGMNSPESEPFLKEALELKKQMGNDPVGLADAMQGYSGFLTNAEENEQMLRNALDLLRKHLSPGHPRTIQTVFSLGQLLLNRGKFAEAEEALREAYHGFQKTHDPNQPYQPIVLRFLAESLLAQGKGDDAELLVRQQVAATPTNASHLDLLDRVLAFRRDWPLDQETLQLLNGDFLLWDLTDSFAKANDQVDVEQLFRDVLRRQRERYGSESPNVLKAIGRLADLYVKQGKLAEAEDLYREALGIEKKLLGNEHLDLAKSLHDLALFLQTQNKVADAGDLFRQELAIRRKLQPDGNQEFIEAFENLSTILHNQGKLAEAETLYREVLLLRRKFYGRESAETIWPVYHLASLLREQGKFAEAETLFLEALALMKKVFGPNDRGVAVTLNSLANMLRDQGRLPEAENLHRKAAEVAQKLPPGSDRDTLLGWSLKDLGNVLMQQGRLDAPEITPQARADFFARSGHWKEAAKAFRQNLESAPDDFAAYLRLAPILLLSGDVDGYRRLCQQAVTRFSGTKDIGTAETVAKTCALDPTAGVKLELVAEAAETAVTLGKESEYFPWFALCKSMAEYRQEHFAGATNWAQKALAAAGQILERDAAAHLVMAMAQMKLKQMDAARDAFAKGAEIVEQKLPKLDSGDLGGQWVDVIIANLFLREARALIQENSTHGPDVPKAAQP